MDIQIEIIVDRKIYDDEHTYNKGFKIFSCYISKEYLSLTNHDNGKITINGVVPNLNEGEKYKIELEYANNQQYPYSYKIIKLILDDFMLQEDRNKAILQHLKYSETTINNLLIAYPNICDLLINGEKEKIKIEKIKGFNQINLDNLQKKLIKETKEIYLMLNFSEWEFTFGIAKGITSKYCNDIAKFKTELEIDPYKTLCDLPYMGFKKTDKLILKNRPELIDSKYRLLSAIEYILEQNENNGNTYLEMGLVHKELIELAPECVNQLPEVVKNKDRFYIDNKRKSVSKRKTFETEKFISETLLKGNSIKKNYDFDTSKFNKTIEGNDLTEKQMEILNMVKTNSINILCGYSGAGKSNSLYSATQMLKENGKSFLLLAPTGRASKVLSNATNCPASTIHRELITKMEFQKLEYDFIFVDEATMIDIFLMKDLLSHIDFEKTSLIFICDPAQLPSVGAGNILKNMIDSKTFPLVFLDKVFRYGEGGLSYVATEMRNGKSYFKNEDISQENIYFGKNQDYVFVNKNDDEILNKVEFFYKNLIKNNKLNINEITCLSAYKKGNYGVLNLNNIIQNLVNPPNKTNDTSFKRVTDKIAMEFRIGDKVIQIKNNYKVPLNIPCEKRDEDGSIIIEYERTAPIFNGEEGIIVGEEDNNLIVKFENQEYRYSKELAIDLLLGYAITVHKSQGSTFQNAIVITPSSHTFFTTRNLLYVATTRARNRVIHIGNINTINSTIKKDTSQIRKTLLYDLIVENKGDIDNAQ